jgi:hypothetical protein
MTMKMLAISATVLSLVCAAPLAALAASHDLHAAKSGSSTAPISKAEALSEIRTDGYMQVKDLHQTKNGWTAKAQESGKPVSLQVNSGGVEKQ